MNQMKCNYHEMENAIWDTNDNFIKFGLISKNYRLKDCKFLVENANIDVCKVKKWIQFEFLFLKVWICHFGNIDFDQYGKGFRLKLV